MLIADGPETGGEEIDMEQASIEVAAVRGAFPWLARPTTYGTLHVLPVSAPSGNVDVGERNQDGCVQEEGAGDTQNLQGTALHGARTANSDGAVPKEQEDESQPSLWNEIAVLCHESANARIKPRREAVSA